MLLSQLPIVQRDRQGMKKAKEITSKRQGNYAFKVTKSEVVFLSHLKTSPFFRVINRSQ